MIALVRCYDVNVPDAFEMNQLLLLVYKSSQFGCSLAGQKFKSALLSEASKQSDLETRWIANLLCPRPPQTPA